jgi:hypothetical protein
MSRWPALPGRIPRGDTPRPRLPGHAPEVHYDGAHNVPERVLRPPGPRVGSDPAIRPARPGAAAPCIDVPADSEPDERAKRERKAPAVTHVREQQPGPTGAVTPHG